jgi:Sec-independent protein translocase protein TatA
MDFLEWITYLGGICGAIITIIGLIVMATKPFKMQTERLGTLENTMAEVKKDMTTMKTDLDHAFDKIRENEASNRTSDRALLALLNHALNGNNQKEMEEVKRDLEQHIWKEG